MRCPDDLELQSYFDNELNQWRADKVRRHLNKCPICKVKLADLEQVVSLLQRAIKIQALPKHNRSRFRLSMPKMTAAAAVLLVMLSLAGLWYLNFQRQSQWSPEGEILLQQYLTLHTEDTELI